MRAADDERHRLLREMHSSYNRRRGTGNIHSVSFFLFYYTPVTPYSLLAVKENSTNLGQKNHGNERQKHSEPGRGSYRA